MVYQKLCEFLCEQLGVEESEIRPETNIIDDLGADSLDVVELVAAMEDEFNIIITDERIRELFTVGEVVAFLEDLLKK